MLPGRFRQVQELQICTFYGASTRVYKFTYLTARDFPIRNGKYQYSRPMHLSVQDSPDREFLDPAGDSKIGAGEVARTRNTRWLMTAATRVRRINEKVFGGACPRPGLTFLWARLTVKLGASRDTAGQQMELVCVARFCTHGHDRSRARGLRISLSLSLSL